MSEALEERVRAGDPDRYAAALFAPEPTQTRLFTLYAFNLELARAPWRVSEPQIGLIRLRWWLDAVEESYAGAPPRAHDVAAPLARLIAETQPPKALFEEMAEARERDLDPSPMLGRPAFDAYVAGTAGAPMRLAAALCLATEACSEALADEADAAAVDLGYAYGVAALLRAGAALAAHDRLMIPPLEGEAIDAPAVFRGATPPELARAMAAVAETALARLAAARARRAALPRRLAPAFLSAWRAEPALRRAARGDADLHRDFPPENELNRRLSLLARGLTGRW